MLNVNFGPWWTEGTQQTTPGRSACRRYRPLTTADMAHPPANDAVRRNLQVASLADDSFVEFSFEAKTKDKLPRQEFFTVSANTLTQEWFRGERHSRAMISEKDISLRNAFGINSY